MMDSFVVLLVGVFWSVFGFVVFLAARKVLRIEQVETEMIAVKERKFVPNKNIRCIYCAEDKGVLIYNANGYYVCDACEDKRAWDRIDKPLGWKERRALERRRSQQFDRDFLDCGET